MAQTLEQLRAADAWQKAQGCTKDYVNLAKGLPALIMNSGLMQVLAFLHEKGSKPSQAHEKLGTHLRTWLHGRFKPAIPSADFAPFMAELMKASRIEAEPVVVVSNDPPLSVIAAESHRSAATFVGVSIRTLEEEAGPLSSYGPMVENMRGHLFLTKNWHDLEL